MGDGVSVVERSVGNLLSLDGMVATELGTTLGLLGFKLTVGMYEVNAPTGYGRFAPLLGAILTNGGTVLSGEIDGAFDGLLLTLGKSV